MKVSELQNIINQLPSDADPDVVMGEAWLPERLVDTTLDGDLLFLQFDNAPEETQGDEEGRGFVEHEVTMIREKLEQILDAPSDHAASPLPWPSQLRELSPLNSGARWSAVHMPAVTAVGSRVLPVRSPQMT